MEKSLTGREDAPTYIRRDAGWSSSVARRAHNPKVVGSNPAPATKKIRHLQFSNRKCLFIFLTYF